jgi:hypothetical protein
MKKEVSIAICIGLILGLIVTFGIYRARQAGEPSVEESAELLASALPSEGDIASNKNGAIVISSPEDGAITTAKEVQVSGTTEPNVHVFVFYGDQYKVEKADGTGNFSTRIPTKAGPMVIVVRTLNEQGTSVEEQQAIFVGNPDEVEASPSPSPSPSGTARPRATARPTATPKATASPTP